MGDQVRLGQQTAIAFRGCVSEGNVFLGRWIQRSSEISILFSNPVSQLMHVYSMRGISSMQCVSGFQPSVQARTSVAQEIKLFFSLLRDCRFFSKIFRMNDS